MSKVIINEVELELDLLDADVVEKYDRLNEKIAKDIQDPAAYEGLSNADSMRYQCKLVNEYFDEMFGEGTANRVFPKNNNIGIRIEAFSKVVMMSYESSEEFQTKLDVISKSFEHKHSKEKKEDRQNRQQRRAAERSKKKNFKAVHNG